jgi:YfiH family protein
VSVSPVFVIPEWPAPARVRAACSTRIGGVSRAAHESFNLGDHVGDDPAAVRENRRRLGEALQLPSPPRWLRQVHGIEVAGPGDAGDGLRADAAWSDVTGGVCTVMTADCLPVLLCDRDGSVVAAVHAGWRGLAAGVMGACVRALPVAPGRLMAWLGPAISQGAFEVGAEVRSAFVGTDARAAGAFVAAGQAGKYMADLYALARLQLADLGVGAVYGGGFCTHGDPARFFSHRRDGECGRMASLIWLQA